MKIYKVIIGSTVIGYQYWEDNNELKVSIKSDVNKIKDILFFNGYQIKPNQSIELPSNVWNQIKQYFFYSPTLTKYFNNNEK